MLKFDHKQLKLTDFTLFLVISEVGVKVDSGEMGLEKNISLGRGFREFMIV